MTDRVDNAFDILKYISVPESQDAKAFCLEKQRSLTIVHQPFRRVVLSAIELDDKAAFVAGEIGDETRDRNLPAKMPAFLLEHAQFVPERLLGIGDIAAQITCEMIGDPETPTPNPSPQGGGETENSPCLGLETIGLSGICRCISPSFPPCVIIQV